MVTIVCVGTTNPYYKRKARKLLIGLATKNSIVVALSDGNTPSEVREKLPTLPRNSTIFWSPNEEFRKMAVDTVNACPVATLEEIPERVEWLDGQLGGY